MVKSEARIHVQELRIFIKQNYNPKLPMGKSRQAYAPNKKHKGT